MEVWCHPSPCCECRFENFLLHRYEKFNYIAFFFLIFHFKCSCWPFLYPTLFPIHLFVGVWILLEGSSASEAIVSNLGFTGAIIYTFIQRGSGASDRENSVRGGVRNRSGWFLNFTIDHFMNISQGGDDTFLFFVFFGYAGQFYVNFCTNRLQGL